MKRHLVLSLFSIFFIFQSASAQFERGYADLVDELLPSVVSIATSQTIERQTRQLPESVSYTHLTLPTSHLV